VVIIGTYWFLFPNFILISKTAENVKQSENYSFEEISEEWENFENEIMVFVTRCKSFLERYGSLK